MNGPIASAPAERAYISADQIGRVSAVGGAQATVEIDPRVPDGEPPTVGKFLGLNSGKGLIIGLITEVGEEALPGSGLNPHYRKMARLDLIGEIRHDANGGQHFQRGVTEYPNIGDTAKLLTDAELSFVYGAADGDHAHIGDLQQNADVGVHIDIDHLVNSSFCRARRNRRRKVERRRHYLAADTCHPAESSHLPGRSAQRIRQLFW